MNMTALLIAMSIPSAITAFCFWMIERRISLRDKRDDEKRKKRQDYVDEKQEKRDELQLLLIKTVNASLALGEATARAVERIPDANCNGDMHDALAYATKVKHEQKDFLAKQGIKSLNEEIA